MPHAQYNDPRLVPLYDLQNRWAADNDFFLALANEQPASRIADVGCGTGRLTVALAAAGHQVTGLEPAGASLQVARQKAGAEKVRWLHGTAEQLPSQSFDLVLMTAHVAQVFLEDDDWQQLLREVRRALVPGGRLAFDSRDPVAKAWQHWDSGAERDHWTLPGGTEAYTWTTVDSVSAGCVTYSSYTHFPETDETLSDTDTLRFRTEQDLRGSLKHAGFEVEHLYGGWQKQGVGQGNGELIVVARAVPVGS